MITEKNWNKNYRTASITNGGGKDGKNKCANLHFEQETTYHIVSK